jgi:predicted hydrocarbon binding protein
MEKLKPVKYIGFDEEKGTLYAGKIQSLVIPVSFIKTLNLIFNDLVGVEGSEILIYKLGESLGREYNQILKSILEKEKIDHEKVELSKETQIQEVCNAIFMTSGWGRINILGIDLEKTFFEVEITFSPSIEFLKESQYSLERGLISGVYREITQEEVFCQVKKEEREKHKIVLTISGKIPEKIKEEEKMILLTRKELEEKIKETTLALEERIQELEKFHRLTVGREIKMVELKEEIERLKKELEKYKSR